MKIILKSKYYFKLHVKSLWDRLKIMIFQQQITFKYLLKCTNIDNWLSYKR